MSHEQNVIAILSGTVVSGSGKATQLGYPTVNIAYRETENLPTPGVYAGTLISSGEEYGGAISFGTTRAHAPPKLEVHCFENAAVRLGDKAACVFLKKINEFTRGSDEELMRKIAADVAMVREFLNAQ